MKMKNFSIYGLLVGAAFATASCDKDVESTSLKVDLATTITVKGYVYAELDKRTAGKEFAPAGTDVILSVPYGNLNGAASNGKWKDTVKLGSNGEFSADVPVDDDGVVLTVDVQPFEYEQTTSYSSLNAKEKRIYEAPPKNVSVSTSANSIIEVLYIDRAFGNAAQKVRVTFTFTAELDNSLAGEENVIGQKVTLFNDGWAQDYTTNNEGKIVADVPYGENILLTINFTYGKKVPDGATTYVQKSFNYKIENQLYGPYTFQTTVPVSLGNGTAL
jgi:hypothetical protein